MDFQTGDQKGARRSYTNTMLEHITLSWETNVFHLLIRNETNNIIIIIMKD